MPQTRHKPSRSGSRYVFVIIEQSDWLVPLSESHLRTLLQTWIQHYNRGRPHVRGQQMNSAALLQHLGAIIAAIGGLGTAAFGLVDASKAFWGGANNIGFSAIRRRIESFVPAQPTNGLSRIDVMATLRENWFTGADLASQKAIAKSLIKLNFNVASAPQMAIASGLNREILTNIAQKIATATSLTAAESDAYARFDAIVTAQLDATYRRADQRYVNGTRACAMLVSVLLAIGGAWIVAGVLSSRGLFEAIFIGLVATPLAPIAKDLSTALATAVNTMQAVKR
jgi:hypothetical protein